MLGQGLGAGAGWRGWEGIKLVRERERERGEKRRGKKEEIEEMRGKIDEIG